MARDAYSYDAVAGFYDELAGLYSLGRIERSKAYHLRGIRPGDRALYVGVGRGRDALAAARVGARVTALDVSPRMLARVAAARDREGLELELIEGTLANLPATRSFDLVVANYFLDLFDDASMRETLRALLDRVDPGGRFCVADFAPPTDTWLSRWLTAAYYHPLNWIASLAGFCARHPIADHPRLLAAAGMRVDEVARFPIGSPSMPAYCAVLATKPARGEESESRARASGRRSGLDRGAVTRSLEGGARLGQGLDQSLVGPASDGRDVECPIEEQARGLGATESEIGSSEIAQDPPERVGRNLGSAFEARSDASGDGLRTRRLVVQGEHPSQGRLGDGQLGGMRLRLAEQPVGRGRRLLRIDQIAFGEGDPGAFDLEAGEAHDVAGRERARVLDCEVDGPSRERGLSFVERVEGDRVGEVATPPARRASRFDVQRDAEQGQRRFLQAGGVDSARAMRSEVQGELAGRAARAGRRPFGLLEEAFGEGLGLVGAIGLQQRDRRSREHPVDGAAGRVFGRMIREHALCALEGRPGLVELAAGEREATCFARLDPIAPVDGLGRRGVEQGVLDRLVSDGQQGRRGRRRGGRIARVVQGRAADGERQDGQRQDEGRETDRRHSRILTKSSPRRSSMG